MYMSTRFFIIILFNHILEDNLPTGGESNNQIVFFAPKEKNVLVNISPTEAILITKSGNVYAGISKSSQQNKSCRQKKWRVKSKLLKERTGEESITCTTNSVTKLKLGNNTTRIAVRKRNSSKPLKEVSFFRLLLSGKYKKTFVDKSSLIITAKPTETFNQESLIIPDISNILTLENVNGTCINSESSDPSVNLTEKIDSKAKPSVKCDECGEFFTSSALKQHTKNTGHFPVKCNACDKSFKTRHSLSIHYIIHTGRKPFVCQICGKSFVSAGHLRGHKSIHTSEKKHQCVTCGKAFLTKRHLNKHEYMHKPYEERPFSCSFCPKRYVCATQRDYHIRSHTGELDFLCELCGESFVNNSELQVHKGSEHVMETETDDSTLTGKNCKEEKNRGENFKRRVKRKKYIMPEEGVWTGDREYKYGCKLCGRRMKIFRDILQHIQRHRGERPYPCQYCGRKFVTQNERFVHETTHTNDRKFECEICGKKYNLRKHLNSHSVVHKEKAFHCQICGRTYALKASYLAHLSLHSGKKLYECTQCKERVSHETKLVNLNCDICGEKLRLIRRRGQTRKCAAADAGNI